MGKFQGIGRLSAVGLWLVTTACLLAAEPIANGLFDGGKLSVTAACSPTQTGSQVLPPSTSQFFELPLAIPEGRNGGDLSEFNFLTGTGTEFLNTPAANSASIYVCIDDVLPQNLKVTIRPLGNAPNSASLVLWDHEFFLDQNGQPIQHIEALANLPFAGQFPDPGSNPPTYSYKVQVLDDQTGVFRTTNGDPVYIGNFNASVLTLNPNNPGHIGPPIVNLYADSALHPLPNSIEFGNDFSVFATAVGNPASYQIDRLGLKVVERVDIDPLHPDLTHPLLPFQQHNSGIGAGVYISGDVAQPPASPTGVGLEFGPPDLPELAPGFYQVTATAWDSAGFETSVTKNVSVIRTFGLLSVANLVRQINTNCDENANNGLPCNTANFSATLNLINNTDTDTGNLRVRLINVPGAAFEDDVANLVSLPDERDFTANEVTVGPVTPLPSCSAQQVQVCGVIPAPIQNNAQFGIGFQVYAVLEECDAGPAQCANPTMPDLWTPVDVIRVTEGEWPVVAGFNGPGGGTNQDRRGTRRRSPFRLDSLTISGPPNVAAGGSVDFNANAILKNSQGAQKQLNNVRAHWSASMFSINAAGLFQAAAVTAPTPVTITASYKLAGITKTQSIRIIVNPAAVAEAAALVMDSPDAGGETADDGMSAAAADGRPVPQRKPRPPKQKPPNVTLAVNPLNISEGNGATVMVVANRSNPKPVAVHYSITGTARLNTHFTVCGQPGTIVIPPGARSASIRLTALANDLNAGSETATVTLLPSSAYKLPKAKKKGPRPGATISIMNVPPPLCP